MRNIVFVLLTLIGIQANAQLRLPAVISDHMVLQQQSDVTLWGWASASEELTVTGSWGDKIDVKTKAMNTGSWKVSLKTPVAGGPYTITIKGKEQKILNDVMIGEVWICSGQSNMEWTNNDAIDGKKDSPNADIPFIRFFKVTRSGANDPQVHGEGEWKVCTPETMKWFSSVSYFFGKKLNADIKIPVGLMDVSWGGTPAEVWTPAEKIENNLALKKSSDKIPEKDGWPRTPGVVYNAMIRPLVPYTIAGAIWYQGEGNTDAPETYALLMKTMIESWRADFEKEFPFYYVQIAPFTYETKFQGALIREQQSKILTMVPKTGMVIISDFVEDIKDIHPKYKKPVGDRLANYALSDTYKRPISKSAYESPVYKSMVVEKGKIRISFMFGENGLINRGATNQFTIAGEDKKFYPAIATIDGNTIVVSSKQVKLPVAVRFCFDNSSIPNLTNKEGLPVSIFRTDSWELDMSAEESK